MRYEKRTFILADGENLVFRFQELLKTIHKKEDTKHIEDVFVWNPHITTQFYMDIVRFSYYSTQIGDELKLEETRKTISSFEYDFTSGRTDYKRKGRIIPYLFKKSKNTKKTKSVDINITIDALRHTYNDSLDTLFILSGDADYIPLIKEVMGQGKRVIIGSFSSGLNSALKHLADEFLDLDKFFFKKN